MALIQERYICIDVEQISYKNFGDFSFVLPYLGLDLVKQSHTLNIKLFVLPFDWLAINEYNSYLKIDGTAYQILTGNPSIIQIVKDLNEQQSKVKFSFLENRGVVKMFNKTQQQVNVDFNIAYSCYKVLGFNKIFSQNQDYYELNPEGNNNDTRTGTNIVNVAPANLVFVRTNVPTTFTEYVLQERASKSLIAVIAMDNPPFSIKQWIDDTSFYKIPINTEGQNIQIKLEDRNGNPIIPLSAPYLIISIQSYDESGKQSLRNQEEQLKLQKLQLLLSQNQEV